MSLHGFPPLASEPSGLPPLPPGWSGSSPAPSTYQLPPVPPESNGWGSSPTVASQHRAEDTFAQPFKFTMSPPSHNGYNTPIIKPLFIDTLARDMKLEEGQKQNLHDFVQLGSAAAGLTQADLATRLFALAVTYSDIAEGHCIATAETPTDWKSMWCDLKIRLDGNFTFTKDQEAAIKKRPESLSLDNVAGVPAREQALASQVRSASLSVRNALCKEILAHIDPENWVSLPQFAYDCVSKYKLGGAGIDIPDTYTAHIALLRCFAFDHPGTKPEPASLGVAADDEDTPRPAKKPRKAKGAQGGGRIATGEDFWGQVDEYFRTEIKTHGKSLIGPKWKS
ncbi:hypothetical protein B0H14DRAFT_3440801 [Mycena olivaceomarginata]|nr:hypothetical protein B0H14DRAFT_3440801 [Mycena olivaceomarginata]